MFKFFSRSLFAKVEAMFGIGKLLGALIAGRTIYTSGTLFEQLLSCVITVVSLAVISALLFFSLFAGVLYFFYRVLVEHGLTSDTALLVLGLIILLALVILVIVIINHLKKVKELPRQVMQEESPISYKVHNMLSAFLNGYNAKRHNR